MLRSHALIATAFVALPAVTLTLGDGAGAFTMYASTVEFRLDLVAHTRAGATVLLAPTSLASSLPPSARPYVAGADHFRRAGDVRVLRHHLDDLARLACRRDDSLADVAITLVERSGAVETKSTARVPCVP
jgi:hypothetical protein